MKLVHNVDLSSYNTFGLHARAKAFVWLQKPDDIHAIMRLPEYQPEQTLWLGGGSNILFLEDYPGLIVKIANRGICLISEDDTSAIMEAQAGEMWHDFVQYTLAQGLSGLENLSLIPGTVGAAPVQNIGAYGVEVGERIESVICFDLQAQAFVSLLPDECRFRYRQSIFKQEGKARYLISAVRFRLDKSFSPKIGYGDLAQTVASLTPHRAPSAQDVADAVCHIRQSKLPNPQEIGNCGSFFHNPIISASQATALIAQYPDMPRYPQADGSMKFAAGWLIDQCGLKGYQIGGAAVHQRQALVLINQHQACADDVLALAAHIRATVYQRFGILLIPEPVCLPPMTFSITSSNH